MIDIVRFFKIRFYLIFALPVDFAIKSKMKVTWVPCNTKLQEYVPPSFK